MVKVLGQFLFYWVICSQNIILFALKNEKCSYKHITVYYKLILTSKQIIYTKFNARIKWVMNEMKMCEQNWRGGVKMQEKSGKENECKAWGLEKEMSIKNNEKFILKLAGLNFSLICYE